MQCERRKVRKIFLWIKVVEKSYCESAVINVCFGFSFHPYTSEGNGKRFLMYYGSLTLPTKI